MIRRLMVTVVLLCTLILGVNLHTSAAVLTFDDLTAFYTLTGTTYAGLTWEQGNAGSGGTLGYWQTPLGTAYPYSAPRNIYNAWGCTLIGITFPSAQSIQGCYIAAQGITSNWTTGVRVHGYRSGVKVSTTAWFNDINTTPDWFNINLPNVDRIVFETVAVNNGAGFFSLDNLTYGAPIVPEPSGLIALTSGLLASGMLIRKRR